MGIKYDEYLEDNPFFQQIQESYKHLLEQIPLERSIICIPRIGSIKNTSLTPLEVAQHFLIENGTDNAGLTTFCTFNGDPVLIQNNLITLKTLNESKEDYKSYQEENYNSVQVLFKETYYNNDVKYNLWCIEAPLTQSVQVNDPSDLTNIVSIRDCIHLLCVQTKSREILERINAVVNHFVNDHQALHRLPIDELKIYSESLFRKCIGLILRNKVLESELSSDSILKEKIYLAVETYMQNSLQGYIFNAICNITAFEDPELNKSIRNLQQLQLSDFTIKEQFNGDLNAAKYELNHLNSFCTVLGKLNCLKRTFNALNKKDENCTLSYKSRKNKICLSADDLLQIILFLVLKVHVNNWCANITYLTKFRLSNLNFSDDSDFLVTNLEAAIEYIRSGQLYKEFLGPKRLGEWNDIGNKNNIGKRNDGGLVDKIFDSIRNNNLDELKELLLLKGEEKAKKPKSCHPLCSCDFCEIFNRQQNACGIKSRDSKGRSPLHVACLFGEPEIIEFLIGEGAEITALDSSGSTPLHYATLHGHQHATLLLLHAGSNMNIQDEDGNSPLHLASNNGHENCVKPLVYFSENNSRKIDLNSINKEGNTPLHLAARWGYLEIVKVLLQFNALVDISNKRKQKPWDIAHNLYIQRHLYKALEEQKMIKPENLKNLPPVVAEQVRPTPIAYADDFALQESYEHKNGHKFGLRPKSVDEMRKIDKLLRAIEKNDIQLTRFFLGMRPVVENIKEDDSELAEKNCEKLKDTSEERENNSKLLSDNSELSEDNSKNISGKLEENSKISKCHPLCICEKCQNLIEIPTSDSIPELEKVNINLCNIEGYTALHTAAKFGRLEILRLLLDSGALITIETYKTRFNVLHIASFYQHLKIVQELLKCGESNVDVQDSYGNTPLHYAAMTGSDKIVECLLKNGANPFLKNSESKSPMNEAEEKKHISTVKLFKKYDSEKLSRRLEEKLEAGGSTTQD